MIDKKDDVKNNYKHQIFGCDYICTEQTINHIKVVLPHFIQAGRLRISKNFQFEKRLEAGIKFEKCKILVYNKIENEKIKIENNTPLYYLYNGDKIISSISKFYFFFIGGPHDTRRTIQQT